ncbi:MAG: primosomal protein N' [Myxococcales bacterium]|nr:primosomal protein N' [Myxococcales bacterium]
MLLARVSVPVPLGQAFTYSVPAGLELQRGARVLCEFGRRRVVGVVLDVGEREPDVPLDKLKPVVALVDPEPVLPVELLDFLLELARYYLAPIGDVMRLALPAIERSSARALAGQAELAAVGRMVRVARALALPLPPEIRGQARAIHEHLLASGPTEVAVLAARFGNARAAAKRLAEAGLVAIEEQAKARDPFFAVPAPRDTPPELTPPQAGAVHAIIARLEARERGGYLLHGVTGSGKTEVYLRVVERALALGGSAIVLVPEIALTPQLVGRFRARLGERIAVMHSGLGDADRHAMWKSLRSGEVRVAVGARSALFAPVEKLALICVDEEHDGSFKQEEGVRYNARDMALLRAHRAGAVTVLGSATPSLGSELAVREQRLERLVLPERARASAVLPRVELIDLKRVGAGPSGHRLLSLPLHRALEQTLEQKGQAILFLNRRGFAPSLLCEACGKVIECPSCAVALTLHRSGRPRLACHYCDHSTPLVDQCPACGSGRLSEEGAGTERIEQALTEAFPAARIARLDRDVAAGAKSEKVLDRMRRREIDVLVGTQMVTKGHDLPDVTLVGVLNADAALSMPDFRAAERTFHLLVQVAGRAGRGDALGKVLIQTWQPEHPAVALAAHHDVAKFVERELEDRRELGYPPYRRIALVRVDAVQEARAREVAAKLANLARKHAPERVDVLGPAPAPLPRLRNRYRFRFMVRSDDRARMRPVLLAIARASVDRAVRVAIDIDPVNML